MSLLDLSWRRRLPVILQTEVAECGMACLAMILGFHGHRIDLDTLRRRYAVSLKGSTLNDLTGVASSLGLATRALRLELSDLAKLRTPCILHWSFNHFVVLARVHGKSVTIHDPATGKRRVSLEEVSREFTGVALEAVPTTTFTPKKEESKLGLGYLLGSLSNLRGVAVTVILLSFGLEIVALLMPIASQVVVDEVVVSSDYDLLLVVAAGLVLLLLLQLFLEIARGWTLAVVSTTVNLHWNSSLFEHMIRLPLEYFAKRHVGDINSRFGSLAIVQKALTTDLILSLFDGVMAIGMLIMLFLYGGWLGCVALVSTGLNVLFRVISYRAYRQSTEQSIIHDARQQTHFIETLRGIASVKLLGLHERRRAAWLNHFVESLNAKFRLARLDLLFGRANDLLVGADRLVMTVLGAVMVIKGAMTLGMLVAFLAYRDQFALRIGNLITTGFQLRMLNVQLTRLADIVRAEPEQEYGFAGGTSETSSGYLPALVSRSVPAISPAESLRAAALNVQSVSFRYGDNESWVFRDKSFEIPPGSCVAITGPSGCGKTTLIKILMGLIRPSEGVVSCNGVELNAMGFAAYRERIAGVLQDDGLFGGSLAENICGFDNHPDPNWMTECAMRAAILDDIRTMPMGFETLVGDMGSTLSGGQKQRIILARALYRRPAILFLDEATSHLDPETEAVVAEALRELHITRVIIAHRPATVAHADIILQLDSLHKSRITNIEGQRRSGAREKLKHSSADTRSKIPADHDTLRITDRSNITDRPNIADVDGSEGLRRRVMPEGHTHEVQDLAVSLLTGGSLGGPPLSAFSESSKRLWEEYQLLGNRDLSEYEVAYMFVDGIAEQLPRSNQRDEVLAAWGYNIEGHPILLHLTTGSMQDPKTVATFFGDLKHRGLKEPLLVTAGGSPNIVEAIERYLPSAKRQRCLTHRMRELAGKVSVENWGEFKVRSLSAYQAPNLMTAKERAERIVSDYGVELSNAVTCFMDDFDACIAHLGFPMTHRRAIQSTSLLERVWADQRRHLKTIPDFGKDAFLKLMFASLLAADCWRSIAKGEGRIHQSAEANGRSHRRGLGDLDQRIDQILGVIVDQGSRRP